MGPPRARLDLAPVTRTGAVLAALAALAALAVARRASRPAGTWRYRTRVGFNPYRTRVKRRTDLLIVAAAFVVIAVLLGWAFFA